MGKISFTDGTAYSFIDICDCGLTGGCPKCLLRRFAEEDVALAEEGMDEYNQILQEIDNE